MKIDERISPLPPNLRPVPGEGTFLQMRLILLTLGLIVLAGCPAGDSTPPRTSPPTEAAAPPPPPPPPPPVAPGPDTAAPSGTTVAAPPAATEPEGPREKAEFGVGAKGHDYGAGVLTTPMSIYFTTEERLTFSVRIPKAMQLFTATENRVPKSHEEFMQKIIKDNDIVLPQLPHGSRYVYDPKTGQLMVERPGPPR